MLLKDRINIDSPMIASKITIRSGYLRQLLIFTVVLILSFQSISMVSAEEDNKTRALAYLSRVLEKGKSIILNASYDNSARIQALKVASKEYADYENVWRIVLGPDYNRLTPEQLIIYHGVFREYLVTMLALRMNVFKHPEFKIVGLREVGKNFLVTTIASDRDLKAPIEWLMTHVDEKSPKIMDIVIRGASMLATQRAEISQIYRNQGFDGLIASMKRLVKNNQPKK